MSEEVLIAFEGGNPEKPFVLGAHYNGAASSGYSTPKNDQKVIHTRSGTKIIMNDAEGSVFIEDPSGNTWLMDGQGNINVNAPKNISINAGENLDISVGKNMTTNVGENSMTSAGKDIFVTASGNLTEQSDNRTEMADNDYTRGSETADIFAKKITATSTEENMVVQSAKTVQLNSGEMGTNF